MIKHPLYSTLNAHSKVLYKPINPYRCVLALTKPYIGANKWIDFSGYGNDGTIHGATKNSDGFLYFNGLEDYVIIPNSDSLSLTKSILIKMVINPVGVANCITPGLIAKKNTGFGLMWMNQAETSLSGRLYQSNSNAINYDPFIVSQNTDHTIIFSASDIDNKVRVYLDGTQQGVAKTYDGTILAGSDNIFIGQQASQFFKGIIKEVYIWGY